MGMSPGRSGQRRAMRPAVALGVAVAAAVSTALLIPATAAQAATTQIVGAASGRCLDVPGKVTTNGTQVELYDCNGGTNQQVTAASGQFQILGKCLEPSGGSSTAGAAVVLGACTDGTATQWKTNSGGTITASGSGLCLDATARGTANGTLLEVWTCNSGTNQNWSLTGATTPPVTTPPATTPPVTTTPPTTSTPSDPGSSHRRTLSLDPNWKFYRGDVSGAQATTFNDASWSQVSLPHTVRLEKTVNSGGTNYQGLAWYRRHMVLDSSYSGRKIYLRFEGAMQVADVWVNGVSLGEHQGGYTPFVFDITSRVKLDGSDNVIAVKLDNRDNALVPPGKPETGLDFNYYGGLYRDVKLIVTDPVHVTDANFANVVGGGGVFVSTPSVSTSSATVQVKTQVQNDSSSSAAVTVKTSVVNSANAVVASGTSSATIAAGASTSPTQSLTVTNPKLWSPDSPTLYTVRTEVDKSGSEVDAATTTLGIRSISWTKANGFLLNGKRLLLNGTNRHQEYPYVGNAVPASGAYRDALLLKEGGANFIRSSHYPPDPAFLDACDQLGILVLDSIPGWQNWNANTTFVNNSYNDIRQMIRRDRNHPSVIAWESSLNESHFPDSYATMAVSITHAEYPGNQTFAYGGNTANAGKIYDIQNQTYSTSGTAALLTREYGDWEFGGNNSTTRTQRSDGETKNLTAAAQKQQAFNTLLAPTSGYTTAGMATWSGFDYNRGYESNPAYSGLMDFFRLPKDTYYFFQSQRSPSVTLSGVDLGPTLTIANWWTPSSPSTVTVYSNATKVNLYLNDTLIKSQSPDTGGNNSHLPHAPFTFTGLKPGTGTLRADGLINNQVVVSQTVRAPGAATHIVVTVDTAHRSLQADGTDFAIVHASLVDANGTVVPTNGTSITFSVSGQGALIGDSSIGANPVSTGAGISSALVHTTATAGQITIKASAGSLTAGTATVTSVASTTPTVPTS